MFPNSPAVQHSLFDTECICDEVDFPDKPMNPLIADDSLF
jgi:hypothetical protein